MRSRRSAYRLVSPARSRIGRFLSDEQADFCGYVVTIALLLLQNFGPKPAVGGSAADAAAAILQWYTWLLYGGAAAIGALTVGALTYFSAALRMRRDCPQVPPEDTD